ncbi:hypothetical protein FRC00_005331 [Tulasnella sp. 408]|nr:hypothetical protein FRC00_005331 [Tulasnella sp. 408]
MLKYIDVMQTDLKSNYKLEEITDSNDPVFQAEVQGAFTEFVDQLNKEIARTGEMEGQARTLLHNVQEGINDSQHRVLDQGVQPVSVKAVDGKEDFVVLHDLRDTIHQGGFGLVFKVKRQDNPNMIYAMKVDLEREKQLWKQLDHQNILPFEGTAFLDNSNGGLGLLSPFIVQRDLAKIIRRKACLEPQRISFLRQISDAIEYLHSLPFIHGDIKPENILIDHKDKALLCDFGLSKNETFTTTAPSHIGAGSPGYVALGQLPNPFDGSREPKNERSDIFAFGKTMAEVIANQSFRDPPPEIPEGVKTDAALAIWELAKLGLSPTAGTRPFASVITRRLHTIVATFVKQTPIA